MSDRVRVRVSKNGDETQRELMVNQIKICDMTALDVCDMIDQINGKLRVGKSGDYSTVFGGCEVSLTFFEAINLQMQATSSLSW